MPFVLALLLAFSSSAFARPYVSESGFLKLSRTDFPLDAIKVACPEHKLTVPHAERRWEVARFSQVATVAGKAYYHLLCRGVDLKKGSQRVPALMDNVAAFLFVSEPNTGMVGLVWADTAEIFGAQWFEDAETKKISGGGEILTLHNPTGGNAGFNNDALFLLTNNGAQKIEAASWKKEARGKLPKGFLLWNELTPDLSKMTFSSPLWREGKDGHASPSGGAMHGTLALRDGKLAVTSVNFEIAKE